MAKKKAKDPVGNAIKKEFKKIGNTITKPFKQIIGYFKCGINIIKNLKTCIVPYLIDMVFGAWFLFWGMLASVIPGLKDLGKLVAKGIKMLDASLYSHMKFHIDRYPKSILNKCYRCPKV